MQTANAINVISFLQVVSQILHAVYNIIYNGIETDKKPGESNVSVVYGAASSLFCCSAEFRRRYRMLSTRRDVYGSEFRHIQ